MYGPSAQEDRQAPRGARGTGWRNQLHGRCRFGAPDLPGMHVRWPAAKWAAFAAGERELEGRDRSDGANQVREGFLLSGAGRTGLSVAVSLNLTATLACSCDFGVRWCVAYALPGTKAACVASSR